MAVELPGGIKVLNPSPTDTWSGPYNSVTEANIAINPLVRYKTMIVRIASDLYWYRNGILDTDLVLFNGENCGTYLTTVPLTLTLPTKGGVINTNIGSGLAYTVGSSIAVTGTGTYPSVYYVDVTSNTSIAFNQAASVDVFMIGGGGGGGGGIGGSGYTAVASAGGGGGAGGYMSVGSIPVASETNLVITVGAGGAGGAGGTTAGAASNGGSTFIQSGGSVYQSLTVRGGGSGGAGGAGALPKGAGSSGGCGGGAGGGSLWGGGVGGGHGSGGDGAGNGYSGGGSGGDLGGGGGGGSGGAGVAGTATGGGGGGTTASLTLLNSIMVFGGGGGGGGGDSGRNAGSSGSGSGYGGGGGSASVSGGNSTGGNGGTGRVILKVTSPVNINPFSSGPVSSYLDTTNSAPIYKFEGLVSSYDRATGLIEIANIQNITGTFAGATAYTFNVNTFNGGNAGTNIEIKDSKVNLSINSDIQMNGKKIVSPTALYLTVPFSTPTVGSAAGFMIVNVNGSNYKIALYPRTS
jgi:hypothetical protein